MRVLFWYCNRFSWTPAVKTLEHVPDAGPDSYNNTIVAFVHVEPKDLDGGSSSETKLVKNSKWLARKWDVKTIILHSFTHLGEEKADPAPGTSRKYQSVSASTHGRLVLGPFFSAQIFSEYSRGFHMDH